MYIIYESYFNTLEELDKLYDEKEHLLKLDSHIIYYDTVKTGHPVGDSAQYSYMLMRTEKEENVKRARDIINKICSLQINNTNLISYGAIPTHLEKIIPNNIFTDGTSQINSTIVWFIIMLKNFKKHLTPAIIKKMHNTCHAAYLYTSMHSNKTPHHKASIYFLIDSFALLCGGEYFGQENYTKRGLKMLNEYYISTLYNESFWEHNAYPEIYSIALMISYIKRNIKIDECTIIVDKLNSILWKQIAYNYHHHIKMLTGAVSNINLHIPYSAFQEFLATGLSKYRNKNTDPITGEFLKCPEKYRHFFENEMPEHFHITPVSKGSNSTFFSISHIAYNYLKPEYTLGSFNREEMWEHHVPFVGYIRSYENDIPYTFRIRTLNNGHDYTSAELHCVQKNGFATGHIFFNINRGDHHIHYDCTNGIIFTNDLRIRFEITGDTNKLDVIQKNDCMEISYRNTTLVYKIPYMEFDGVKTKCEVSRSDSYIYYDTVFEIPENGQINLNNMKKAIYQFVFHISSSGSKPGTVRNTFKDGFIITESEYKSNKLRLETPYKPNYFEYSNVNTKSYINNILAETYADDEDDRYHISTNPRQSLLYNIFDDAEFHDKLHEILNIPMENLFDAIINLMSNVQSRNYNIEIFKMYSTHVILSFFERMKSENMEFNKIIEMNYFDIYQKINDGTQKDEISKTVLNTVAKLIKSFNKLNSKSQKNTLLLDVISLIEQNYSDSSLSLTMISEKLGISESYISREFKNKSNTNYVKYLIHVRMEKAKELLLKGDKIEKIVSNCGYLNVSSFKRAFKGYTGMSITSWLNSKNKEMKTEK